MQSYFFSWTKMDYYSTLGVGRTASDEEIKKAYRKMAMKHHPDRGGDESTFKKISEAYEVLSDPKKKQMIDMGVDPKNQQQGFGGFNSGPFEFHFGSGDINDMFNNFNGFGFGRRPMHKNKTVNIVVDLTLEDVLNGKDIDAEIDIPGSKKRIINISIPPGIDGGQQIRYQGMGDHSIPNIPAGDLIVNVRIRNHHIFKRESDSLIVDKNVSVWDAILGCKLSIDTLDNKNIEIIVPPGTQPDTVLSCRGEGLPNMRTKQRGNLLIRIKISIPRLTNESKRSVIEQLKYNGI